MYEATFKEVGFRLPFSSFQISVLGWLELCPAQLKTDCFAYMTAFELVCGFLRVPASKNLFFAIFTVQRNLDKAGGCNWVSFRQRSSLFEAFSNGVARFHERIFLVRPRTEVAFQSVLRVVERPHGENGVTSARVPHFHFSWSRDHLKHDSTMYRYNYDRLTGGNPVLDSRGNLVTRPRLIDTRALVFSKNPLVLLGMLVLLFFFICSLEFSD
jgi:hypothetical protein